MQAVVRTRYGSADALEIRQMPKPKPGSNEVLVRVHATTVSRTDCGMLRGKPALFVRPTMGLFRPKRPVLGLDFAGTIEAVGSEVTLFESGDRVFGMSADSYGAHAEYLCLPETAAIATMPLGLSFVEAVICEGAWYADTFLKRFWLANGEENTHLRSLGGDRNGSRVTRQVVRRRRPGSWSST